MIKVELNAKPIPVSIIYQPVHKLVMILAILRYGTRSPHNAPFMTFHLYLWALRDKEGFQSLIEVSNNERTSVSPWSFEPGLEKTITIALVNEYCSKVIRSGSLEISLNENGKKLLKEIELSNIFSDDIEKVKMIGIIPKSKIFTLIKNWSLN